TQLPLMRRSPKCARRSPTDAEDEHDDQATAQTSGGLNQHARLLPNQMKTNFLEEAREDQSWTGLSASAQTNPAPPTFGWCSKPRMTTSSGTSSIASAARFWSRRPTQSARAVAQRSA